ncbi:glycosyltransferase family 2 protein [Prolixibacteraceae bacterium Z1-6]|uniref:Glycosyltransferase family 2 protein n=1 Tax=Draconibacterium aestuarii TaxID=2998507 RepID=A0A9X3J7A0_9BACT|nr:glycosyltransferase family 2 protein [Prolixibacteraceae bacterium Z1-6]
MSSEKTNPEVSVILPFYNAENTLQAAIKSILNQSFKNFELLLIDNNSNDNSYEIARRLAASDSRIILLNETKQGVANAMNFGLQNARGRFLARMDADDISLPTRLEKQLQFLNKNPEIDFAGSEVKYIAHSKNTAGFRRFVARANSFHTSEEIERKRFIEIPIINPTLFFRRKLFEKYGACLDGNFPEDYEMQLRYLEAGVKMAKLPEPLLEWHDYSTRLTRTDKRYSTKAFFKTKAAYFKKWSEKNNLFHPVIWVWGAGRKTRQRSVFLEEQGLKIKGRIDIKESKDDALFYEDIPGPGKLFVVSMVNNTGAGENIRKFLLSKNYSEGVDFILMG